MQQEKSELAGLLGMLYADLNDCLTELDRPDARTYLDRAYVRALFALIEGATYRMRQILLAAASQGNFSISETEARKLREVRFDIRENGQTTKERPDLKYVTHSPIQKVSTIWLSTKLNGEIWKAPNAGSWTSRSIIFFAECSTARQISVIHEPDTLGATPT
jgi:hypothetical protein